MRFQVDLDTCQNHGQCCLVAPEVFSIDEQTRQLSLHLRNEGQYRSPETDEALRDDITAASDMCPTQAITILD